MGAGRRTQKQTWAPKLDRGPAEGTIPWRPEEGLRDRLDALGRKEHHISVLQQPRANRSENTGHTDMK